MSDTIVNVHQASVSTVSVEIKAIRISNKQMTISVFKQLQSAGPLDIKEWAEEGDDCVFLRGIPWGVVNFTHKPSPRWCDYYLIWQWEHTLLKSPMCKVSNLRRDRGLNPYGKEFFMHLLPDHHAGEQIWAAGNGGYIVGQENTKENRESIVTCYYDPLIKLLTDLQNMDQLFISV